MDVYLTACVSREKESCGRIPFSVNIAYREYLRNLAFLCVFQANIYSYSIRQGKFYFPISLGYKRESCILGGGKRVAECRSLKNSQEFNPDFDS